MGSLHALRFSEGKKGSEGESVGLLEALMAPWCPQNFRCVSFIIIHFFTSI